MAETVGTQKKKTPGKALTAADLFIAGLGLLIVVLAVLGGGDARAWWIILVGLVLAGIGFAQRILADVERR